MAKLKAAVAAETALKQQPVLIRGLLDLDEKIAECRLLIRGDYNKPGAVVPPAVPEVLANVGYQLQPQAGYKTTGIRTAFARWLTDPQHPLTSRVHVNRVWARLFGRGIVPGVANFGLAGDRPTHPELLDWLASEFTAHGWSQKKLYRELLTSSAWRQSSEVHANVAAADPKRELLSHWRAQRLTGEMLRDSTLAASGKLNGQMLGAPTPVSRQADGAVPTADDAAGNRRSIYLQVRRSQHVTMLELFDVPMMEVNCPERPASIVPLQALALLHGPFTEQSAAALAQRILRETPASDEARLDFAWMLLFSRPAKPAEKQALTAFLQQMRTEKPGDEHAWTQAALVLLNSNEFLFVH